MDIMVGIGLTVLGMAAAMGLLNVLYRHLPTAVFESSAHNGRYVGLGRKAAPVSASLGNTRNGGLDSLQGQRI